MASTLALGWLATATAGVVLPGGHPPAWYVVGAFVVLASFVAAPIGAAAAFVAVRRTRHEKTQESRRASLVLAVNVLLFLVAVALWFWFQWEATRR